MDNSFRLSSILTLNAVKKYKNKPDQSVAHGVQKRLQHSIQNRKSSRLTLLNTNRNLETCSPAPQTPRHPQRAAGARGEGDRRAHRLMQLEKWKLEKQQKKRDEASVRRKPFLVGVAPVPLKYEPPPPLRAPRLQPSTSGRVTRSQAMRVKLASRPSKLYNNKQSFAPTNADFKPKLNYLPQMPLLLPLKVDNREASQEIEKTDVQPRVKANCKSKRNVKSTQVLTSLENRVKLRTRTTQVQTSLQSESGSSSSLEQHEKLTKSFATKRKRIGRTAAPQPAPLAAVNRCRSNNIEVEDTIKLTPSERSKRTPKRPIPKSESNSEERLRSPAGRPPAPPAPVHPTTPALSPSVQEEHISPNVTCSRGKDNARREFKKKLAGGELDLESAVETVSVLARQLETEHTRLHALADSWEPAATDPDVPEEAQELVLASVGQTRLLLGQKMSQFRSLIARAERPDSSAPLVTRADLQGYWDMMFMQITDVDLRFKKLEGMRACGWQECSPPAPVPARPAPPPRPAPAALRRAAPPRAPLRPATSRLKDFIAVARLARRDKTAAAGSPHPLPFAVSSPQWRSPRAAPRSPAIPADAGVGTPLHNRSLLQTVLSSEAQRSARRSSFAMMRSSLLSREVQIDGVRPLQRTPECPPPAVTPARSILKSTSAHHAGAGGTTSAGGGPRARKTVLFTDDDYPGPARDENARPVLHRQPADLISLDTPPAPPCSVAARLPRRSERLSRQDTPLRSLNNLQVSHLTPGLRSVQLDDSSVTKATPDVTPRRRSTRRNHKCDV